MLSLNSSLGRFAKCAYFSPPQTFLIQTYFLVFQCSGFSGHVATETGPPDGRVPAHDHAHHSRHGDGCGRAAGSPRQPRPPCDQPSKSHQTERHS